MAWLPLMKIHCAELVQGALRSALSPEDQTLAKRNINRTGEPFPTLQDSLNEGQSQSGGGLNINFLDEEIAARSDLFHHAPVHVELAGR